MEEHVGVWPKLQMFDHHLSVDIAKSEVRVDGAPNVLAARGAKKGGGEAIWSCALHSCRFSS
jgi:hypothetical protein